MSSAIVAEHISFGYNNQTVLEDISFRVEKNEFVGIVGPNGGGKSTLIKLIAGLIAPSSGNIQIFGKNASDQGAKIGYVPQDTSFNPSFPISVIDTVKMGFLGTKDSKMRQKSYEALEKVGMKSFAEKKIGALSGGERQRVFVARALVGESEILLLDEPTASVDPVASKEIYQILKTLQKTVLLVSHDILDLVGVATKIASINKKLIHFEDLEFSNKEICCEVDLLDYFLSKKKDV